MTKAMVYDMDSMWAMAQFTKTEAFKNAQASVDRSRGYRYVHERSTTVDLDWQCYDEDEERAVHFFDKLEDHLQDSVVRWNKQIYRDLEAAYEDVSSEARISESFEANEIGFDPETGKVSKTGYGVPYAQLEDRSRQKALEIGQQWALEDPLWSEFVIDDWTARLEAFGFNQVEIAFSGFWSQGDGASFTAKSINLETYVMKAMVEGGSP